MSFTRDVIRGLKNALTKKQTIEWKHELSKKSELIWRLPNEKYKNIKDIDILIVKEYERAALIQSGFLKNVLTQGSHTLPINTDEIIYIDISPQTRPFGVPKSSGLLTKDQSRIGFSGNISFKIKEDNVDIGNFITKIVSHANSLPCNQLIKWLREGPIYIALRDVIKDRTFDQFLKIGSEELQLELESKIGFNLTSYGIELLSINITNFTIH